MNASLAVTDSVQICCAPVLFAGAVHVGVATLAAGAKVPVANPPEHDALQA